MGEDELCLTIHKSDGEIKKFTGVKKLREIKDISNNSHFLEFETKNGWVENTSFLYENDRYEYTRY